MRIFRKLRSWIKRDFINGDPWYKNIWWSCWTKLIVLQETIERMFYWGWKMRHNYDFQYDQLLEVMHMKMVRMYNCFEKYGNCVWNQDKDSEEYKQMKSLKLCITLLDRLIKDEYDEKWFDIREKRYGKSEFEFEKVHDKDLYKMIHYIGGVAEEDMPNYEKYREDSRNWMDVAYRRKQRDTEILFKLMNRDIFYWWD